MKSAIAARIAKLEAAKGEGGGPGKVVSIIVDPRKGHTTECRQAAWLAEHPGVVVDNWVVHHIISPPVRQMVPLDVA